MSKPVNTKLTARELGEFYPAHNPDAVIANRNSHEAPSRANAFGPSQQTGSQRSGAVPEAPSQFKGDVFRLGDGREAVCTTTGWSAVPKDVAAAKARARAQEAKGFRTVYFQNPRFGGPQVAVTVKPGQTPEEAYGEFKKQFLPR